MSSILVSCIFLYNLSFFFQEPIFYYLVAVCDVVIHVFGLCDNRVLIFCMIMYWLTHPWSHSCMLVILFWGLFDVLYCFDFILMITKLSIGLISVFGKFFNFLSFFVVLLFPAVVWSLFNQVQVWCPFCWFFSFYLGVFFILISLFTRFLLWIVAVVREGLKCHTVVAW